MDLEARPLTPERWADFEAVMGPQGGDSGCWCMWNRQTSREFGEQHGEPNHNAMRGLVEAGDVPGLIGYVDDEPVGWVSVAPREAYGRLARSRVTKPVDNESVWSVTCFVVPRRHRRLGVASALLLAAVDYARERGATAIEGYPVEPRTPEMPPARAWMGLNSMFEAAGFSEIARRSPTRPFYRLGLGPPE